MGLYLLIPTFAVILLSVLIVRAGAIALRLTGLDEKTANFQALSAFTRAGFTTRESESVVSHPQRRTIVSWLIVLGNAGIVAVIVTGTSSLTSSSDYRLAIDIAALLIGSYVIYRLVRYTGFTRRWENFIENRMIRGKFFRRIAVEHLLHLQGGYGAARAVVTEKSPFVGKSLKDGDIASAGISVLGIERKGQWIPGPDIAETVDDGDSIIVFGRLKEIEKYFSGKGNAKDG